MAVLPTDVPSFGLSLKGRSVGSGLGVPPWDELLGTCLPPLERLSPDTPADAAASAAERSVLEAQAGLTEYRRAWHCDWW